MEHLGGVGPSHHPSLQFPHREDDFYLLQCLILTFLAQDMLSQRLKTTILVTVAMQYYFPLELSPWWLGDGQNKICILSTLAKVMGVQSQKYQKMTQNRHILRQIRG